MRVLFTITCSFFFFISAVVWGEIRPREIKGPLTITASTLTADQTAQTALFEGMVNASADQIALSADRMLVFYGSEGRVNKIEVTGRVRLVRGEQVITADRAFYLGDEQRIVFLGQPTARKGDHSVTGTKMTYLIKEDRSVVENGRVSMGSGSPGLR